jgi:UDP-2-acetamido-2-deoxy-ribo-hexuluronate aminotransferase
MEHKPVTSVPRPVFGQGRPEIDVPSLEFSGLKAQYAALGEAIRQRIAGVLDHGRFIMGPEVAELEAALAAYCGARHCVTVSSGTDALLAPLMAAGVGPGDAVFLPGFTFTATAEVVLLLRATPVFVDVDERSFNIDAHDLADRIAQIKSETALRPRAILGVDLFGLPADYDALANIAAAEDILLVADAAQSFGARRRDRKVGTLAPVTATSFFPAKPFGCFGDGGAVFTDDTDMAEAMRSIRAHGKGSAKYDIVRVGLNARLDTIQAAVLLAKLPALAGELDARNALADHYDRHLPAAVVTPRREEGATSAWAQYSILADDRDRLQKVLGDAGVPTAIYYPRPLHFQPAYQRFGYGKGSLPVCERLCSRILSLPMHGYMHPEAAGRVVEAVTRGIANG